MKKNLMIIGLISILLTGSLVYAITLGVEPPASYINNLKTCTKSTITQKDAVVSEYTIKGLLPNGRCEVYMSSYTNFEDPKVYEGFKTMSKAFAGMAKDMAKDKNIPDIKESDIPTQQEMIIQGKKEKQITVCKFSRSEREALYNAYQKHDSKNPPAKFENGNISFSFDTNKMSSYDNLMMKLNNGPCTTYEGTVSSSKKEKKYACEYSDTTCYWTVLKNGGSMSCTNEPKSGSTFDIMDKVEEHVKAGMCQEID